MDIMQIGTSITVVALTYIVGVIVKSVDKINDKYIPAIVCVAGCILGGIGMYVIPDYPAKDILTAIAVGGISGLASTGVNQLFKQALK